MSEIVPFSNGEFRLEITPHDADGFRVRAPGVARQLGFREAFDLLRNIPDAEKGSELVRTPNGGQQQVTYLTEAGFYRALGQRQAARIADSAARGVVERFQSWVFGEVLPKLRRGELGPKPAFDPSKLSRLDILKLAMQAEEEKAVLEAALESAAPAIAYHDRFVASGDVLTVKAWAAQFGLTEPDARALLMEKRIIYRFSIGERWSEKRGKKVEEFEYRARAGRVTFGWFDLRPQHNAPRHHNGQVRQTLYVRQQYALDLGKKVGLTPVAVQEELPPFDRSGGDTAGVEQP